jgi:membrane associated rhomboid family serine protease
MSATTSTREFSPTGGGQEHCYRHPSRETNVSCSNCGNPICPDCMTPSPVGMRCPDCASDRTKVVTAAQIRSEPDFWKTAPVASVLIGLNLLAFLAQLGSGYPVGLFPQSISGWVSEHGVFFGPLIASGEYWRVITAGFLHLGIVHIAFNMYLLFVLGRMIEPAIGSLRFGVTYVTALLAGSLGAMILDPGTASAGASGAIFGLMGLAFVVARSRGIDGAVGQIGGLILLNLLLTFGYSGISKGAHLGGLIAGAIAGFILMELDEKRHIFGKNNQWAGSLIVGLIGVALFAATVLLARNQYPQFV